MTLYRGKLNVLFINGGSGGTSIMRAFDLNKFNVSSLINCYDDGKSTGKIRDLINILGPSDIRKVQSIYLDQNMKSKQLKNIYDYRLPKFLNKNDESAFFKRELLIKKNLKKKFKIKNNLYIDYIHKNLMIFYKYFSKNNTILSEFSLINCIITAEFLTTNNIKKVINKMSNNFDIKNEIVLNSYSNRYLYALSNNGNLLGEEDIVLLNRREIIRDIFLLKKKIDINLRSKFTNLKFKNMKNKIKKINNIPKLSKEAKEKINKANIIIYCPGTQHSSLYPTYITKDFSKIISKNKKALKVFISNIHNDYDTHNYKKNDYILNAFKYLNLQNENEINDFFDLNIINFNYSKNKIVKENKNNIPTICGKFNIANKNIHNGKKIFNVILDNYNKR